MICNLRATAEPSDLSFTPFIRVPHAFAHVIRKTFVQTHVKLLAYPTMIVKRPSIPFKLTNLHPPDAFVLINPQGVYPTLGVSSTLRQEV